MIFDTWFGLLRVLVVGTAAYAALVLLLRASGKRTDTVGEIIWVPKRSEPCARQLRHLGMFC